MNEDSQTTGCGMVGDDLHVMCGHCHTGAHRVWVAEHNMRGVVSRHLKGGAVSFVNLAPLPPKEKVLIGMAECMPHTSPHQPYT